MEQPKALRLADELTRYLGCGGTASQAAAELRRLSAVEAQRDALLEAAKEAEPMLQAMLDNIRKTLPQYTKMPALDKLSAAIKAVEEGK